MPNITVISGSGAAGAYVAGDPFGYQTANKIRDNFILLARGIIGRNQYWGGDDNTGLYLVSAPVDALNQGSGIEIDNTGGQLSGSSGIVIQVRTRLRVEDVSITVTPEVYNITDGAIVTSTGGAACSAINLDFSGSNQEQTLTFTPASGVKRYKVRGNVSASSVFQVWISGILGDIYIA